MTDQVLTFAWMYPVTDIKINECAPLGTSYRAIGNHIGINDHTIAVSEQGTGAGRLYCTKHQAIFHHSKRCPVCAGKQEANSEPAPVSKLLTLTENDENSGDDHDNPQS